MEQAYTTPLCVDLDGTLVGTNTLFEAAIAAIKQHPANILAIIASLLKGKAAVKHAIGLNTSIDASLLPYNTTLITWLTSQRTHGRHLILATASDEAIADAVAKHLGIFDEIIASTPKHPVSAHGKYAILKHKFGNKGFAYAGNSHADLAVWQHASSAILVNTDERVTAQVRTAIPVEAEFPRTQRASIKTWLKTIRVHQWIKNLLIFTAPITAHRLFESDVFSNSLTAFISFSFLASSVYILNDLLDIPSDRLHPTKRLRPIASGAIQLSHAAVVGCVAACAGIAIAVALLPMKFISILLTYFIVTAAYSLRLKKIPYVDILILSGLYVLRIVAGGKATGIPTSNWLFLFAAFMFVSLGIAKRVTELTRTETAAGRGYTAKDRNILIPIGVTTGILACGVLALYTQSATVSRLYTSPAGLVLIVPVVALWLARMWKHAIAGSLHDDPVLFAAKDKVSYAAILILAGILLLSL